MKNTLIQNPEIQQFKNALVTDVELKNGCRTQVLTVFNHSDIDLEVVNIGIREALAKSHRAVSMQSSFYSIKTGELKKVLEFERTEIQEYNPEKDLTLNPHKYYGKFY